MPLFGNSHQPDSPITLGSFLLLFPFSDGKRKVWVGGVIYSVSLVQFCWSTPEPRFLYVPM